MRAEPQSAPLQKPLRRLARTNPAARGTRAARNRHFIEPKALTEKQKGQILRALSKRKIGDDASRRLFVAAAEYELADFQNDATEDDRQATVPEVREPDPVIATVTERARTLSECIRGLSEATRALLTERLTNRTEEKPTPDTERALAQLECEIGRIAGLSVSNAPSQTARPEASQPVRHLVASLAHIFEGCFEQPATPGRDAAFSRSLAVLVDQLELPIPLDEETLTDLLVGKA